MVLIFIHIFFISVDPYFFIVESNVLLHMQISWGEFLSLSLSPLVR